MNLANNYEQQNVYKEKIESLVNVIRNGAIYDKMHMQYCSFYDCNEPMTCVLEVILENKKYKGTKFVASCEYHQNVDVNGLISKRNKNAIVICSLKN